MNRWMNQPRHVRCLVPLALALSLAGCAGDLTGDETVDETAREELSPDEEPAIGGDALAADRVAPAACSGQPPPPIVCNRVVCIAADQSWDYQPLAAGTPCQGAGVCDGQGSCVMPPPSPRTLAIPSDQINQQVSFLLATSQVWLDASGNSPPLITGYRYECTDPPGPLPWYCWIEADVHHSYVRFSDELKNSYLARTMRNLFDFAFPAVGVHCGFGGICATVNQINGDLGELSLLFGQSSSGAYARLSLPIHSPSSTVIINSGMPDLELTDMQLSVYITLTPWVDLAGRPGVRAADVQAVFDFDANFNNFPDWLIGLVYDVSEDIRARLRDGVHQAFQDEDRRSALAAALTTAIEGWANLHVPGWSGFASINYISASNGVLYVHYVPN